MPVPTGKETGLPAEGRGNPVLVVLLREGICSGGGNSDLSR